MKQHRLSPLCHSFDSTSITTLPCAHLFDELSSFWAGSPGDCPWGSGKEVDVAATQRR